MVAAVRVHKFGGPEGLTYEEIDVPAPAAGQIRVKQHACGVNYTDVYFRKGMYQPPGGLPFVAGSEGAGEVIEVGSGVANSSAATASLRRRPRLLRCGAGAAHRSRHQASGEHQLRASRRHDAQRPHGAVFPTPHLQGGEGDDGADPGRRRRGRLDLLPMGEPSGANVIGTVGSKEKAELARANGCHHTILYREEDFRRG